MKKLLYIFILIPYLSFGQIKLSQLSEAVSINNSDLFLLTQGAASKKLPYSTLFNTIVNATGNWKNDSSRYASKSFTLKAVNDTAMAIRNTGYITSETDPAYILDSSYLKSSIRDLNAATSFTYSNGLNENNNVVGIGGIYNTIQLTPGSGESLFNIGDPDFNWGLMIGKSDDYSNVSLYAKSFNSAKQSGIGIMESSIYMTTQGATAGAASLNLDTTGLWYGSNIDTTLFGDYHIVNKRWVLDRLRGGSFGSSGDVQFSDGAGGFINSYSISSESSFKWDGTNFFVAPDDNSQFEFDFTSGSSYWNFIATDGVDTDFEWSMDTEIFYYSNYKDGTLGEIFLQNGGSTTASSEFSVTLSDEKLLKVTNDKGGITLKQLSGSLTDGAPTAAEITAIVGLPNSAASGAGFQVTIKDSDGTGLLYKVESDGTNVGLPNSAASGAGFQVTIKDSDGTGLLYKVESDGTNWYYTVMTKAL